jgi:uncharacterized membrane protein
MSSDFDPVEPRRRAAARPAPDVDAGASRARSNVEQQKFGGMHFGVAFFGWLTATGLTVLLLAIITGIGGAIGASNGDAAKAAQQNPMSSGIAGVIILLVVLLIAYYAGGYVAGRMARFSGIKQGIAVWLWAVIVTVILAIIGAIAGAQFDALSQLGTLPADTFSGSNIVGSIIGVLAVAVITLVGAILGGLAGMRYHRKVDRFRDDAAA